MWVQIQKEEHKRERNTMKHKSLESRGVARPLDVLQSFGGAATLRLARFAEARWPLVTI